MREYSARCEWEVGAELGEGPLWDAAKRRIYFVDLKSNRLHALDTATQQRHTWTMPDHMCWIVPRRDGDGFMAGLRTQVVRLWLEPELRIEPLKLPLDLHPDARLNDAKADKHGHIWFGSMNNVDPERHAHGKLMRLSPKLELKEWDRGIHICNGPAFSPDGSIMYHSDSTLGSTFFYGVDANGVSRPRTLWRQFDGHSEGWPDGMTVDTEGGIWIAHWGGSRVCRYLPDGTLSAVVEVPAPQPSSVAFGGPEMKTLYITSARAGMKPEQLAATPQAGGLFSVQVDVRGLPAAAFG